MKNSHNSARTIPNWRGVALVLTVILGLLPVGCGTSSTASNPVRSPKAQGFFVARSCPALKEQTSESAPVGVFLEIADVTSRVELPLGKWLAAHAVEVKQLASLMVPMTLGKPATAPWRNCLDPNCTAQRDATLTVNASDLPSSSSAPIALELEFSADNAASSRATVRTGNQEPALAQLSAPLGSSSVVVTPYYLFEPKDQSVKSLMQCASQRAPVAARTSNAER